MMNNACLLGGKDGSTLCLVTDDCEQAVRICACLGHQEPKVVL